MIASEAKYHAKCLVGMYNKVSRVDTRSDSDEADDHLQGIAFAQLVSYMEEFRKEEDTAPVFELAGLVGLYTIRLKQQWVSVDNRIHSTKLKMRLLSSFPDLTARTEGRDILLTFDQHLGGHSGRHVTTMVKHYTWQELLRLCVKRFSIGNSLSTDHFRMVVNKRPSQPLCFPS